MSAEDNKELIRRHFELLGKGDVHRAAMLWAREAFNHGRRTNPGEIEAVYRSLAVLQERHTLHEMIAEGEWVAVRTTCEGVHKGEPPIPVNGGIFTGIPPSNRFYSNQHLHLFRVVNGKIKEHWANRDDVGVARQIGLKLTGGGDDTAAKPPPARPARLLRRRAKG